MIDRLDTGGTETQLLALIRHLDRSRVRPSLCLLNGADAASRSLEPADCPILRLEVASLRHPKSLWKLAGLMRFLRRERIDVIQLYFPDSTYAGLVAARLAGVRRVVRTRNNLGYWMTPLHLRLGRMCNRLTDLTIANCDACRNTLLSDEAPPANRVTVVQNGLDLSRFSPKDFTHVHANATRVGIVANLRPVKDLPTFIRAATIVARRNPEAQFLIAGKGSEHGRLVQLAERLGIASQVRFLGTVADVPTFLTTLDVAVLCSTSEGLSNAILEYMAAGLPIVATNVGGSAGLIRHEVNGLLVPPRDHVHLADAVDRLLRDRTLAMQLGRTAHKMMAALSHERRARAFEDLYFDLCDRKRRWASAFCTACKSHTTNEYAAPPQVVTHNGRQSVAGAVPYQVIRRESAISSKRTR